MLPNLDRDPVDRPGLAEEVCRLLVAEVGATVGMTTGLHGAGGFGKTTLAVQVCSRWELQERFSDGLLWVTVGQERHGPELAKIVNDVCEHITGHRPGFSDPEQAGHNLGRVLDERPDTLLVVDDVWTADQLRPFLLGGASTTRLVTTRIPALLPDGAAVVRVDEMENAESRQLLSSGVDDLPAAAAAELLRLTGRWPLLLALVNGALRRAVRRGVTPEEAVQSLIRQLASDGPTTLDVRVQRRRERAVHLTVQASLMLLPEEHRARYLELGIFAEDTEIPPEMLHLLWGTTGRLSSTGVTRLCEELCELSLVASYHRDQRTLRLHDVLRAYLRHQCGEERLTELNGRFVDQARPLVKRLPGGAGARSAWWDLPPAQDYLWRNLCYHLAEAGLADELAELTCDLRWVERKSWHHGVAPVESDLQRVSTPVADALRETLGRQAHLLGPIEPRHAHADVLISRLDGIAALQPAVAAFSSTSSTQDGGRLRLANHWPLPDSSPLLRRVLLGHTDAVTGCCLAPDGSWFATTSNDRTVRIWNLPEFSERTVMHGHTSVVADCAAAPDGSWLVTAGWDHTARIWDMATGSQRTILTGHTDAVTGCAVARSGTWIVTVSWDGTALLWDAATGADRGHLRGHRGGINACAIAPDGTWLVTASEDGTARIWDAGTRRQRAVLRGHTDALLGCAVAPDGTWLATCGDDGTTRTWDVDTGQELAVLSGHVGAVMGCAVTPDGHSLVTVGKDHTVRIWNAVSSTEKWVLRGHKEQVNSCTVAPTGGWLATTSNDATVRIWNPDTAQEQDYRRGGHTGAVNGCAVARDGTFLVTAGSDHTARMWDVATRQELRVLGGHTDAVTGCAIEPAGAWLATWGRDYKVRLWAPDGQPIGVLHGHSHWVDGCAIAPDGTWLATCSEDRTVFLWEMATMRRLGVLRGHADAVTSCAIAPDGAWLASTSRDRTVRLWDRATMRERVVFDQHTSPVTACAIAPDGRWMATSSWDRTLRIWDTTTMAQRAVLRGHQDGVASCAVSPCGRWIATAGRDQTVRVWNATTYGNEASMRVDGELAAVSWLPDAAGICAAGTNGVYLFALATPALDAAPGLLASPLPGPVGGGRRRW